MKVCVGGTFDPLHKGHKILIKKALQIAGENDSVFIGISTGKLLENKINVSSYDIRKKNLEIFLSKIKFLGEIIIQSISNEFGPTLKGDFDAIVVSPETINTAKKINIEREKIGKKPLKIIQIPFVLAEDGFPISSTRIREKKIDVNGENI